MKTMIAALAVCGVMLSGCGGGDGHAPQTGTVGDEPTLTPPQPANFIVREFGGTNSSVYERYGYWELKVGLHELNQDMDIPLPVATIRFSQNERPAGFSDAAYMFNMGDIGYEMSGYLPNAWPTGSGEANWSGIALGISTGGDYDAGTERSQNPLYVVKGDFHLSIDLDSHTFRTAITDLDLGYPDMIAESVYFAEHSYEGFHFTETQLSSPRVTPDNLHLDDRWWISGSFRGRDHSAVIGTFSRVFQDSHPNFPSHILKGIFAAAFREGCVGFCN